ncbi:MAG: hypothetical protein R3F16_00865 [Myxococcota bacterium]
MRTPIPARTALRVCLALASALTLAADADASDGVIEINQTTALAGGVTSSDEPGFPVTLDAPGSYRLTGNLDVPNGTDGIEILASSVTLDLGGFRIAGPSISICPPTGCNDGSGIEVGRSIGWLRSAARTFSADSGSGACVRRPRSHQGGFPSNARVRVGRA